MQNRASFELILLQPVHPSICIKLYINCSTTGLRSTQTHKYSTTYPERALTAWIFKFTFTLSENAIVTLSKQEGNATTTAKTVF